MNRSDVIGLGTERRTAQIGLTRGQIWLQLAVFGFFGQQLSTPIVFMTNCLGITKLRTARRTGQTGFTCGAMLQLAVLVSLGDG